MDIDIGHERNPLMGWDVTVVVNADKSEKITFVRIDVNGFPEVKESVDPPVNRWRKSLTQQGNFPGDNKVLVVATNGNGEQSSAEDQWS
jgi:hypothetical protein